MEKANLEVEKPEVNEEFINSLIKDTNVETNKISDGYHTFGELYDHRIANFIALCRIIAHSPCYQEFNIWRSNLHSDGSSFEGWFVLGINREEGKQITYHLPMAVWEKTWFADTLIKAPVFDGHSSEDVLKRIFELI